MALEIFKLVGSIFVDNSAANESLAKTDEKASSVGATLLNGVGKAAKFGTAIVGATTAAAGAVMGLANNAAGTADTIDKASIRMGISAESYQELAYAAGQCGVEMTTLEKGAKKLEGTGLNMDDAMSQIMAMTTAEERAAKAAELFGETVAYQMSPLIEQSTQDYDGLIQRAHDLGLVMSEESVKAGVVLGDTMADIKDSMSMIGTNLGSAVIPVIQQFADIIINNMPMIQQAIGQLGPVLASMAATFLPVIADLAQMLLPLLVDLINQLLPVITSIASMILPIITELLEKLMPPLMQIVEAILPVITTLLNTLMPIIDLLFQILTPILDVLLALIVPLVELASAILQPIIELLGTLIEATLKPLMPVIETVAKLLTMTLGAAFKTLEPIIDNIRQVFGGLIDFITGIFSGDWEKAWKGIVDIFDGIFSAVSNIFKAPINFIINGINSLFSSLDEIKIPDWVPVVGGSSFSLPQIPLLAKGGIIQEAGDVIVGDDGPEMLSLPVGAKVTPLDGHSAVAGIDYDKLTECITSATIAAIRVIIPELPQSVIVPDESRIFKVVRRQAREHAKSTGSYMLI